MRINLNIEDVLPAPVAQAYVDGRIMETSVPGWLAKFERAPEATAAELAGLTPGLRPEERRAVNGAALDFDSASAFESLFGRRSPGAPGPAPTEAPAPAVPQSPAPAAPRSHFGDADFAVAFAALFPGGVDGTLAG